ncbi:unnamed protein product, partial [Polarella glacialis]
DLLGAVRGRVIDVKPGELRGDVGGFSMGGAGGSWDQSGQGMASFGGYGMPQQGSVGSAMDWTSMPGAGSQAPGWGSFSSSVPSPYSSPAGMQAGSTFGSRNSYSQPGWQGLGAGGASTGGLPSETEVTETYASFGMELQQWAPCLAQLVDQQ